MILADVSIKRPVFATMMIAAIVVFGIVLYSKLNVDLYPDVNFPMVTVTVVYPGASPETMEAQVADPIEEAVNSLSGIRSLRSSSMESVAQIFLEFDLDIEVGAATQEVRDRISTIQDDLPAGAETPNVQKLDLGAAPIMQLALHGSSDETTLLSYAEDRLKPEIERIRGVGQVDVVGGRDREMHVWLRPDLLRSYGLTVHDVVQALASQNIELPGGRVERGGQELVVRTDAQARSAESFESIVIATRGATMIRLGDVASVEDGFEEARSLARVDGLPAVALVIRKQSDANTVVVAQAVSEALPTLRSRAPQGAQIDVLVDNSRSISASIETVEFDLVLGALLAVGIIFLFLRDPRATLISALALPTSVIGTFGFVKIMGFTLNMMTTLALSLSIGILIDDAIVVIENIVRRRSSLGEDRKTAAGRGTAEIGLAVLATTLSIVAVFVPVAFMEGMLGQFFYEFGLTVAFAVLLSLFVSFTLTPMLSSRFLKSHHGEARGISKVIERALIAIETFYRGVIRWALQHRWVTIGVAVAALIGAFAAAPLLGFEFIPTQDTGQFSVKMELPPGTRLSETADRAADISARLRKIPGVVSTFTTVGGGAQEKVNAGDIVVTLTDREARDFHQVEAMAHVRHVLKDVPNMLIAVEPLQSVGGSGARAAPVQLDLRGPNLDKLAEVARRIADQLENTGGYVDVDTTYRSGKPELKVDVDRDRAGDLGVMGAQIATTVRAMIAGEVATQVEREGERYDVRVQLPKDLRQIEGSGAELQVRGANGTLIDLSSVSQSRESSGPSQIDRQSRQRQVSVLANLDGKVLGDALDEVGAIAATEMSDGVTFEFGGSGKMLNESVQSMLLALFLAVICVYMILASQFESFVHPFTIMASLPFSLIGAFGALLLTGMSMSIFAMIGLIMLMGLVTKNAILLIDFAIQRRQQGEDMATALENAGAIRLRPILMTTAAMIFGMLPVAIGHGDGGEIRAPMGVIVIGGLITSTILTLVVVPVIYTLMEGLIEMLESLWATVMRRLRPGASHAASEQVNLNPLPAQNQGDES
jgi:HAE1 family hydrophobic/amphiphilic exporter-1